MADIKLKAEKRDTLGRKVKRLREEGLLPANVYGKNVDSQALKIDAVEFEKVFREAGETGLVELQMEEEKRPVLIHDIQFDPVKDVPIHVDFYQVNLKEKVTASVPVETAGESPAEKQGLGTAVQYIDEIEVEALPLDLPERFEIDITSLEEVDDALFVKDLEVDKEKVEIKVEDDEILVKVEPLREEEEEPLTPLTPEDVIITEEAGVEEGEVAEGEVPQEPVAEKPEEGQKEGQEEKEKEA